MARPRFDADLIADLRSRVIAHNSAVGRDGPFATKLEALKKVYAGGHRGAKPAEAASKAVEQHLALRKAEFDEAEVNRDEDGKFASKGGLGQRKQFADVKTQRQDARLRDTNAGYRASQTQVIPEQRWERTLPAAFYGGAAAAAALGGAFASDADPSVRAVRGALAVGGKAAGWVAGKTASSAGVAAVNAALTGARKLGASTRPINPDVARRVTDTVAHYTGQAAKLATHGASWAAIQAPISANAYLTRAVMGTLPKVTDARSARQYILQNMRGRAAGAATGLGIAYAAGSLDRAYNLGEGAGKLIDAWAPRRVDKVDQMAGQILAKAKSSVDAATRAAEKATQAPGFADSIRAKVRQGAATYATAAHGRLPFSRRVQAGVAGVGAIAGRPVGMPRPMRGGEVSFIQRVLRWISTPHGQFFAIGRVGQQQNHPAFDHGGDLKRRRPQQIVKACDAGELAAELIEILGRSGPGAGSDRLGAHQGGEVAGDNGSRGEEDQGHHVFRVGDGKGVNRLEKKEMGLA
jgi:hypothetical protein